MENGTLSSGIQYGIQYSKIPIISPGLIFVQKAFFLSLFSEGVIIGGNFAFQNGLDLTVKTAGTNVNRPWAYIREGLLSEGYLCLKFGELIFGRIYIFFGGGGGAYNRNFMVCGSSASPLPPPPFDEKHILNVPGSKINKQGMITGQVR